VITSNALRWAVPSVVAFVGGCAAAPSVSSKPGGETAPVTNQRCEPATPRDCFRLGQEAESVAKDLKRAREYYEIACGAGDPNGCFRFAVLTIPITEADGQERRRVTEKGCIGRSAAACGLRGDAAYRLEDAQPWYRKACDLGAREGCKRALELDPDPVGARSSCVAGELAACAIAGRHALCEPNAPAPLLEALKAWERGCSKKRTFGCERIVLYAERDSPKALRAADVLQMACKRGARRACDVLALAGESEARRATWSCLDRHVLCGGEAFDIVDLFRMPGALLAPDPLASCLAQSVWARDLDVPHDGWAIRWRERIVTERDPSWQPPTPGDQELEKSSEEDSDAGGLEREEIAAVIGGVRLDLGNCYNEALAAGAPARGLFRARFVIGPDGTVEYAGSIQSETRDLLMERCILGLLRGLKYPPPRNGEKVNVTYPWIFVPDFDW
jgi:hypothetical protein